MAPPEFARVKECVVGWSESKDLYDAMILDYLL